MEKFPPASTLDLLITLIERAKLLESQGDTRTAFLLLEEARFTAEQFDLNPTVTFLS